MNSLRLGEYKGKRVGLFNSHSPFSNFHPSEFTDSYNHQYPNLENYFHAQKARCFNDFDTLNKILSTKNPGEAKRLGREVSNFQKDVWDKRASSVMLRGLGYKFHQSKTLMEDLRNTRGIHLVEAYKGDRLWASGVDMWAPNAFDLDSFPGLNRLGQLLMQVREEAFPLESWEDEDECDDCSYD